MLSFLGVIDDRQFPWVEKIAEHMPQGHQEPLENLDHVIALKALRPGPGNDLHGFPLKSIGANPSIFGSE
jgi:hypothetical protein